MALPRLNRRQWDFGDYRLIMDLEREEPAIGAAELDPDRKRREREFHNDRFSHESREAVGRFYAVLSQSGALYRSEAVARCGDSVVLEYGCGPGSIAFLLSQTARSVVGIDISDVAIASARKTALERCPGRRLEFAVMDAERLAFDDNTFDLICGRAILHHLDLERSFREIARTLKPGGAGVFYEPLGHNPAIRLYRHLTPAIRTPDEHPLLMRDFRLARRYFERVQMRPFCLLSLLAVPFRARSWFPRLVGWLDAADQALFRLPLMGRFAWTSVVVLENPRKDALA
jgi:SAM-dependent methyltransferase